MLLLGFAPGTGRLSVLQSSTTWLSRSTSVSPLRTDGVDPLVGAAPSRTAPRHMTPRAQAWSDPALTREYLEYCTTGQTTQPSSEDGPSVIVGASGRVGTMLAFAGAQSNFKDVYITRGESIPADAPGPVYLCVRAEDLEEIFLSCPKEKKDDLVLMSNGMFEKLARKYGVDENTRANLYLACQSGKKPIDGRTTANPDGLSTVCGKWADALVQRLATVDMSCHVRFDRDFRRGQLEKLIWISAFNLVGAVVCCFNFPGPLGGLASASSTDVLLETSSLALR
jgi:hypothetical protein